MKAKVFVVTQNGRSKEVFAPKLLKAELKTLSIEDHGQLERELAAGNYDVCVIRSDELSEQQFNLLRFIRTQNRTAKIIVSVGSASVDEAVRYIKAGAADFVVGDPGDSRLTESIEGILPRRVSDHAPTNPDTLLQKTPLPGRLYITIPLGSSAREAERKLILETLAAVNKNKSRAARILGLSRKTLLNKLHAFERESLPAEDGSKDLSRGTRTPPDRWDE